jgi:sec-independent protein translocase protein TatA
MFLRNLGPMELVLLLAILLLIFGPGRISRVGTDLGKAIRGFREGIGSSDEDAETHETNNTNDE